MLIDQLLFWWLLFVCILIACGLIACVLTTRTKGAAKRAAKRVFLGALFLLVTSKG